ncbi:MAG: hypothetical protein JSU58_08550 [Dehalococcoidales bacterium]|nr:MAG: hypothetical protein JSU58_08550 [Dehalococcoidales bacterium]
MNETLLEVLKWVGLALAAGFVGYFGRYLAMQLIEKTRRNKSESIPPETPMNPPSTDEASYKAKKKKSKAEIKKAKKSGK